jgi:Domain of unknown function (DUF4157)
LQAASINESAPLFNFPIQRKADCSCGGGCPKCSKNYEIQAKLEIGDAHTEYEREADQVAEKIVNATKPNIVTNKKNNKSGNKISLKRFNSAKSTQIRIKTPPSVYQTLNSTGQTLDVEPLEFMQSEFGHDFSSVQIHTHSQAAQSAREIGAKAYTVGKNIVFGSGQYQPHTAEGKFLLAHELAHVIQQDGNEIIQRVPCGTNTDCPRTADEIADATRNPHQVGDLTDADAAGILVSNFAIESARVKIGRLSDNRRWQDAVERISNSHEITWRMLGFSDCGGEEGLNTELRTRRANNLHRVLPTAAQTKVSEVRGANLSECMAENTDAADRSLNRSVFIRPAEREIMMEEETVPRPTTPPHICGPDVTTQVQGVLREMQDYFSSLSHPDKCHHCHTLHSLFSGLAAWDIMHLYCQNADWIDMLTRTRHCAIPGNGSPEDPCDEPTNQCTHSVRHSGRCVLAGTLNYFAWGQMHRLCHNYSLTSENHMYVPEGLLDPRPPERNVINPDDFEESDMTFYINLYKGWGAVEDPSAPVAFARAAFRDGAYAVPPVENRRHCNQECPARWASIVMPRHFDWTWMPGHYQR